ncbi:MAG: DUF4878 domain-containing protein [Bacteroidota bacterium]|nr:DUF4878 domain-containing protein [Bacteroidota bacterium]
MKKFTTIGFVLLFTTFMFSCGGGSSSSPQDAAESFLKALTKQDYDTAKKYSTETTVQMLTMIESMAGMASEEDMDMGSMDDITWGETDIDGDNAVVHYKTPEGDEKLDLKKVDGDWKVDMKKEM